jgi:hypothetical protein
VSDNEEFDPALAKALRDIPPAGAALRDAHIAAALAEMNPSVRRAPGRLRILTGVAAAAVVALGGAAFVAQQDDVSRPALNGVVTTLPPKTGALCADTFSEISGESEHSESITHQDTEYALFFRDGAVDVYRATPPCTSVSTLDYTNSLLARTNEATSPTEQSCNSQDVVHQFNDADNNYSLVVLHTENGISVRFADRCDVDLVTLALP